MQENSSKIYHKEENDADSMVSVQDFIFNTNSALKPMVPLSDYLALYQKNNSPHNDKEETNMDDNKLLEKYMDKVDADQRSLREEMREREERITKMTADSEARIDAKLSKIEEMIVNQNNVVNAKFEKIEDKFEKMEEKFDNSVKDIKGNKIAIWGICIATILSVAGIAYAAIQVFQGFVNLVLPIP